MSTYVSVVISPATTTSPVVISVSQATRPFGSSVRTASSTESEIWSAILSGCPSVTDSEVNWKLSAIGRRLPEGIIGRGRRIDGHGLLFGRGLPRHEPPDQICERDAVEHGAYALGDR